MPRAEHDGCSVSFATCDSRTLRFLSAHMAPRQRIHVEESERFESAWVDFHEHARPLMLGRGPKANASQRFADEHREPEELAARFARDAVKRLDERAKALRAGPLVVFAEGRFLGHLRSEAAAMRAHVLVLHGNLAPLAPGELALHPLVVELVREIASGGRELPPRPVEAALRKASGNGGIVR